MQYTAFVDDLDKSVVQTQREAVDTHKRDVRGKVQILLQLL
jgi:hypothetical protein